MDQIWPWRSRDDDRVRGLPEWCDMVGENYEGEAMLREGGMTEDDGVLAHCVGQLIVSRVVIDAVRLGQRAEDLAENVAVAGEYVDELELTGAQFQSLMRLLAALIPFDAAQVSDQLVGMSCAALSEGLTANARFSARLAYECARAHGARAESAAAARAMARAATLDECPRTARRWHGRATLHALSLQRERKLQS